MAAWEPDLAAWGGWAPEMVLTSRGWTIDPEARAGESSADAEAEAGPDWDESIEPADALPDTVDETLLHWSWRFHNELDRRAEARRCPQDPPGGRAHSRDAPDIHMADPYPSALPPSLLAKSGLRLVPPGARVAPSPANELTPPVSPAAPPSAAPDPRVLAEDVRVARARIVALSVELAVAKAQECPICFEAIVDAAGAAACNSGHVTHAACSETLSECSVCRRPRGH